MSNEGHRRTKELTFGWIDVEKILMEFLKYGMEMILMFSLISEENNNVIKINHTTFTNKISKNMIHEALRECRCITQSEQNI
jgi:hypothetical protein